MNADLVAVFASMAAEHLAMAASAIERGDIDAAQLETGAALLALAASGSPCAANDVLSVVYRAVDGRATTRRTVRVTRKQPLERAPEPQDARTARDGGNGLH